MSLEEQNQMLYILHRKGVSRKGILFVMNDLVKNSNIFTDCDIEENNPEDWDLLDEQAYWLFDSGVSSKQKRKALESIKERQKEYDKTKRSQYVVDQQNRIQIKREELIAKGVIKPDPPSPTKSFKMTTRYGRSPLHEAVSMRDIRLIEKYLKSEQYLDVIDNNGYTSREMAYYEGYQEALLLFEKYEKIRKVS